MARTLSRSLASIVEALELTQPETITLAELAILAKAAGLHTDPKVLAGRLRDRGWLLPTGTRGVWEFAPGAHAGAYGHGEPTMVLRAALVRNPGLGASLALGTAAWAHGLADRLPARLDVAIPREQHIPSGLARETRVTRFTSRLEPASLKHVPTHRIETVLVHLAAQPNAVHSWSSVQEWLPDAAAEADPKLVRKELANRTKTASVRLGYLLETLRPDISASLQPYVGGKVWFGPRGPLRRHSERWQVADTLLPFDPLMLTADGDAR
jgi:predicted transcriptional regulator of viral defense system